MTKMEITSRLEDFVRDNFEVAANDRGFDRQSLLFEEGYVDSIGVAELLVFIEARFGLNIPDEDLLSDDFTTIHGIAKIIDRNVSAPVDGERARVEAG